MKIGVRCGECEHYIDNYHECYARGHFRDDASFKIEVVLCELCAKVKMQ